VGSYENHVAIVIPAKFGNRKFLPQIEQFKSHFRFFLLLWKLLTGSELFGPKEFLVPKYWGGKLMSSNRISPLIPYPSSSLV